MTLFAIVLYLHVLAAIGLFSTLGFEGLSLFHLRRAATLAEARLWIEPIPHLPLATAASGLIVLYSGVYLTMRMQSFNLAWPRVSLAALLLIAPLGALTGEAYAWDPPGLRRREGNEPRTAQPTAVSGTENLPWHPVRRLLWHCPAHGCQAGLVAISWHCGLFGGFWPSLVPHVMAPYRVVDSSRCGGRGQIQNGVAASKNTESGRVHKGRREHHKVVTTGVWKKMTIAFSKSRPLSTPAT